MKFKLHALEFEIEGSQETVKTEFKNFHDNILTPLIAKVNIAQNNLLPVDSSPTSGTKELRQVTPAQVINNDYPTLKDVKLRDLPQAEPEWVLIYCFYASEHGSQEFTREDILKLYDSTDRKMENRIKNLSNNIKSLVSSLLIKSTNDTNFIILPDGIQRANEILAGKSPTKANNKRSSKSTSKEKSKETQQEKDTVKQAAKSSNNVIAFVDLKLKVNEMQSLKEYFVSKSPKSQNDNVAVAINWYCENISDKGATIEEINYLIKIATNNVPSALGQVLINMKGPKLNLVSKGEDGKYMLTSIGNLHVADLNN